MYFVFFNTIYKDFFFLYKRLFIFLLYSNVASIFILNSYPIAFSNPNFSRVIFLSGFILSLRKLKVDSYSQGFRRDPSLRNEKQA